MHTETIPTSAKVIALHCSGAGAGQWKNLAAALGSRHAVEAPEHYGCDSTGHWAAFVDYWGGAGAFASLRPAVQSALIRWILKAPLDFRALIEEGTPLAAYAALDFPVLVMRGEHAPAPTRQIAEMLPGLMADAHTVVIEGAGHMGPMTHAEAVAAEIAGHIRQAEESARARTQTGSMSERCFARMAAA